MELESCIIFFLLVLELLEQHIWPRLAKMVERVCRTHPGLETEMLTSSEIFSKFLNDKQKLNVGRKCSYHKKQIERQSQNGLAVINFVNHPNYILKKRTKDLDGLIKCT